MQKPHWEAWQSTIACCTGCNAAPFGYANDQLVTWAGPHAWIRFDNLSSDFKAFSVREIDPQFFDRFDTQPLGDPPEWQGPPRGGEAFAREFDARLAGRTSRLIDFSLGHPPTFQIGMRGDWIGVG